jgi:Uma2 family endonuclease
MSTVTAKKKAAVPRRLGGERRWVIRDVVWDDYETLVDLLPERSPLRVAFDGKDMEIMVKGRDHEDFNKLFDHFVVAVASGLGIAAKTLGELTWKRPELDRGIEADNCYYIRPEKLAAAAAAKDRKAVEAEYPNPDLAIEVDISRPKVDRPGIYAAMGVCELWTLDADRIKIEQLGTDGRYHPAEASQFLLVRPEQVRLWLLDEDSSDTVAWTDRLRSWAKKELRKKGERRS